MRSEQPHGGPISDEHPYGGGGGARAAGDAPLSRSPPRSRSPPSAPAGAKKPIWGSRGVPRPEPTAAQRRAAANAARRELDEAEDGSEPSARLRALAQPRVAFGRTGRISAPVFNVNAGLGGFSTGLLGGPAREGGGEGVGGGDKWTFRPQISERSRQLAERHTQARRQEQQEQQQALHYSRLPEPAAYDDEDGPARPVWVDRLAADRARVYAEREVSLLPYIKYLYSLHVNKSAPPF
ncbi:hypothetical protein T492DRAFT_302027 [Pavlovales sp. CCMP2436]|nr:hypothetical protein T492DRAFT_302027 [Pavlovales sp. CCMP2436]